MNAGGAGMSAIAIVLAEMGHEVSGHDPSPDSPFLGPLRAAGVVLDLPDRAVGEVDLVVVSTATPDDHPQVVLARGAGVPVAHRSRVLAALSRGRRTLAVSGTHGKTTTTALLATILEAGGHAPGYVVGAAVAGLGRSATWGAPPGPLVIEADESDGSFLALEADAGLVTNVEPDHLEHWGDEDRLRAAFEEFVAAFSGPAVLCVDDPGSAALVHHATLPVTYGTSVDADYRVVEATTEGTGVRFDLHHAGEVVPVTVPGAPGAHNARNAAGALALAHQDGISLADGAQALAGFCGVSRRFEVRGEAAGVVLVDSYDHLPTEVAAALAAAASGGWARVVCCFQPHRYSRTAALGRSFADAFDDADLLLVTDVYPAGEPPRPGVTGKIVVDAVLDAHPWKSVAWLPHLDDVVSYLGSRLRPGDLCLTLGAGDLTSVPDRVLRLLEARS